MKARVKIDPERIVGRIDPNIYGQFMCRRAGCSEGGLYDPEHSSADAYGIRQDVSGMVADLKPPLVRWPGGCTGTSYHWMDGVGPKAARPKKIDLHFGWPASYDFGTVEFIEWCRRVGAEPHMNLAMGTGSLDEALSWLEYCNSTWDTQFANLRRQHGYEDPLGVKYWQLGNENYGPWEIGHSTATGYAEEAREWSKVMRRLDPSIKMIAVGGHDHYNPDWARTVIPEVAPYVDYIAFHTYWNEPSGDDPWTAIMSGPDEAGQLIGLIHQIIQTVKHKRPEPRKGAPRDLKVACTEWNAAPTDTMMRHHPEFRPFGPTYHLREALAVASFLNIMQRRCNQITLSTVAQSINVVGLVMVNDQGAWREPVYWPLWMQVRHSGPLALDAWVACDRFSDHKRRMFDMPYLDCSCTLDPDAKKLHISMVNRSETEPIDVDICVQDALVKAEGQLASLYHVDSMAMNSPGDPDNVSVVESRLSDLGESFTWELKPHAYEILTLELT